MERTSANHLLSPISDVTDIPEIVVGRAFGFALLLERSGA
jgi:hypothetical protein